MNKIIIFLSVILIILISSFTHGFEDIKKREIRIGAVYYQKILDYYFYYKFKDEFEKMRFKILEQKSGFETQLKNFKSSLAITDKEISDLAKIQTKTEKQEWEFKKLMYRKENIKFEMLRLEDKSKESLKNIEETLKKPHIEKINSSILQIFNKEDYDILIDMTGLVAIRNEHELTQRVIEYIK